VSYKRLLQLAAIGAKRELESALCDFQVLCIKSETEPVDCNEWDNARISVNKASGEYADLNKLIKALESF
jgi:hypothetical protein